MQETCNTFQSFLQYQNINATEWNKYEDLEETTFIFLKPFLISDICNLPYKEKINHVLAI